MFHLRRPPQKSSSNRKPPSWGKANNAVIHFFAATVLLNIFIFGPFIYITNENFNFFQSLSIESSPTLLTHLEREQRWFNLIAIGLLVAIGFSNWRFGMKLLRNFRGQMFALDRHLKHLVRGEWFVPPLRVRKDDDFKDVVEQYSYFYKSIQAITKTEIQTLEQMNIDPSQRETYLLWKNLINQKKARLGYEEISKENSRAAELAQHWKKVI